MRDRTRIFFVCFFFQATGEVPETADIINNIIEMAGIDEDNDEVDEDAAIPEPPAPTHAEFYAAMNIVRSYSEKHQLALAPWRQLMMEAERTRTTAQADIRTFFNGQPAASASSISAPRFPSSIPRVAAAPVTGVGVGVGTGTAVKKANHQENQHGLMELNEQDDDATEIKPDEDDHEEEQDDEASTQMAILLSCRKSASDSSFSSSPHLHSSSSSSSSLSMTSASSFFDVERKDLDEHEPHEQDMMIIHENKDDGSDSSSRSSSSKISSSSSCTSFSSSASSSSSSHVPTASSLSEVSVHPDEQSASVQPNYFDLTKPFLLPSTSSSASSGSSSLSSSSHLSSESSPSSASTSRKARLDSLAAQIRKRKRIPSSDDEESASASAPAASPAPPARRTLGRARKLRRTDSMDVAEQFDKECKKIDARKRTCPHCNGQDSDEVPAANPRIQEWVQCEWCLQWWHALHAGISHDDFVQIDAGTNEVPFYCPTCNSATSGSSSSS